MMHMIRADDALTRVAAVQIHASTVVAAAAAHHVVLEVGLGHIQRWIDLHLQHKHII